MPLTAAQLATLKSDVAANNNTIPAGQPWTNAYAGVAVSAVPNTGDGVAFKVTPIGVTTTPQVTPQLTTGTTITED